MKLEEAYELLGLDESATPQEIDSSFRKKGFKVELHEFKIC